MIPCIAIIDNNTLSSIALETILWDIFPTVEIVTFSTMEAFYNDCNRHFVHFFISSEYLLKYSTEFDMLKNQTIVTHIGPGPSFERAGFQVLDISIPEQQLVAAILQIHANSGGVRPKTDNEDELLSSREKEVLALVVKGYINKEIADMLNISVATVIFHRNNISTKLGTRSIGKLTIHAVLSGIVSIDEI